MTNLVKWLYRVLFAIVCTFLALEILNRAWYNAFLCALTLILFGIPGFLKTHAKLFIPSALEVLVLLFIFAAEILGELRDYYHIFPYWDIMLHTTNGFLCAAIGLALVDILNKSPKVPVQMSPFFVVFVAFCFANTVGVMWEFFEYGCDRILGTEMQKIPALQDTMEDLLVNFGGAVIFCVFGYFYIRRGKAKGRHGAWFDPSFVDGIMIRRVDDGTVAVDGGECAPVADNGGTVTVGAGVGDGV